MRTPKVSFDQLEVFGKFLALGYRHNPDLKKLSIHLSEIVLDWGQNKLVAHENRIFTNIIAITVENPELFSSLNSEMKQVFKIAYMENWRRSELIKKQLKAVSKAVTSLESGRVLMIKGGLRLFDNLYPTVAHRYMADLDLYFEDPEILKSLSTAGYMSSLPNEFDLKTTDHVYLDWHQTQDHHLPPIYHDAHPCALEMHQHMVHLRAVEYYPSNPFGRSTEIAELPGLFLPNPVDEVILNLLHSKYGDMFTDYSNFRVRNVFEGYLLFNRLTDQQKLEVGEYFESMELTNDLEFWKLLCVELFDADEFFGNVPSTVKLKFFLHKRFGQSPQVNSMLYVLHFVYRMISKSLWTSQGRKRLIGKLKDTEKRQRFVTKLKKIVGL